MSRVVVIAMLAALAIASAVTWYQVKKIADETHQLKKADQGRGAVLAAIRRVAALDRSYCLSLPRKLPFYSQSLSVTPQLQSLFDIGLLRIDSIEGLKNHGGEISLDFDADMKVFELYQKANDAIYSGSPRERVETKLIAIINGSYPSEKYLPEGAEVFRFGFSQQGESALNEEKTSFCFAADANAELDTFTVPSPTSSGVVVSIVRYRQILNPERVPEWARSSAVLEAFPKFRQSVADDQFRTMRLVKTADGFAPASNFSTLSPAE